MGTIVIHNSTHENIENTKVEYIPYTIMTTAIIQAYCKLACFQLARTEKYNICTCFPHCKVLNNTLSSYSSSYIQGPYASNKTNDCFCTDTCKHTNTKINNNKKYKK